jgi:hypothetical protein
MKMDKFTKLKRPRYPISEYVQEALEEYLLVKAFEERPAYQQNDYIGWITRADQQKAQIVVDEYESNMKEE